jgi:uncharacterized protein (TIGR03435 family)
VANQPYLLAIALTLLFGQAVEVTRAQTPRPTFEVASVKRNVSTEQSGGIGIQPGGRFQATNAPVFWMVLSAYGEFQRPLISSQLVGAPDWLQSEHYDIVAKTSADVAALSPLEQFRTIPLLLRSLLEDRFKINVHRETRTMPIYALTFAKQDRVLGPKMKPTAIDCTKPQQDMSKCGFNGAPGRVIAGWVEVSALVSLLANTTEHIVVDRTGLQGRFDIELEWSPDQTATDKPSIFAAVQEQLGLKLEADRGPVSVVVIDHIERPTED